MLRIKRVLPAIVLLALAACAETTGPTSNNDLARSGLEEAQDEDDPQSRPGSGGDLNPPRLLP